MGQILRVDLSKHTFLTENVPFEFEHQFLGGSGVAAALFIKECPPETSALGPDNRLIFSVGSFCGTAVPFCGRHYVLAKSPLTGILGEASAGGFFGKELKATGFDHIIFSGKSREPVFLVLTDDVFELRDAKDLWGLSTSETENQIKSMLDDDKYLISSIGPAGENLVKFAGIVNEKNRAAARCGLGAVMGSKNLKAIAIKGSKKTPVLDKEALLKETKKIHSMIKESQMAMVYREFGTPTGMDSMVGAGDVPIKNFTLSRWKGTKNIGFEALKKRGEIKKHGCFNCPVACTGIIEHEGNWTRWPEYETLAMLGSNLMVDNLEAIIKWNQLANDFGIDTISLGGVIACFLEALETNQFEGDYSSIQFPMDETGKIQVWGATEAIGKIIHLIGTRQDIGDILAEGVKQFVSSHILSDDLDTTGKGLEVPAHEPRANNLTFLDYATTTRGAYHCYMPMHLSTSMNLKKELDLTKMVDRFGQKDAVVYGVIAIQNASQAYDACGGCIFGFNFLSEIGPWVRSYNAIMGTKLKPLEWVEKGEKIFNLKREYNLSCGMSYKDDSIGSRFFQPIEKGGTRKNIPPADILISRYYELRGWDEEGRPGKRKKANLRIGKKIMVEAITDMLIEAGVDTVFGLPGGCMPFLYEEIYKREEITTYTARHEGCGTAMADMYGRMTRKPGIFIGQGIWTASNGGFGIMEAYYAGSPMVVLTEFSDWFGLNQHGAYQSGTGEYGTVDLPNIFRSYTKYVGTANSQQELLMVIQMALKHATSGRPGPAVVITKWNVLLSSIEDIDNLEPPLFPIQSLLNVNPPCISPEDTKAVVEKLIKAHKPVMICGRGTVASNAYREVRELAELIGIPVATTWLGKGIIAENHDLALGTTGGFSQKVALEMIKEADLILALGTTLAPDNTNNCSSTFMGLRTPIIHVDIDSRNMGWTYPVALGITSDVTLALREIITATKSALSSEELLTLAQARVANVKKFKADEKLEWFDSKFFYKDKLPIPPERLTKEINSIMGEDDLLVMDAGNNRMWICKLFQTKKEGQIWGPGGAAGMGWGACAALTAAALHKGKGKVIATVGDGGLMMCLYVLEMARNLELDNLIYVVFNNSVFGNVRDYLSTKGKGFTKHPEVNFVKIAASLGVDGSRVETFEELVPALEKAMQHKGPFIVDVIVQDASHMRIKNS